MREQEVEDIYRKTIFLSLILIFSVSLAVASQDEANQSLQDAASAIRSMENLNLSTDRVNDLYSSANRSYRAQQTLENPDYSQVISEAERVVELKDQAIVLYDDIQAFNETLNNLENPESLDLGSVRQEFNAAVDELEAERYSESSERLEAARDELSSARSSFNQAQALYQATTNDIIIFVQENTLKVASATLLVILFSVITFNELQYLRVSSRVEHLEEKEDVIIDLMEDTEKRYYVERDMDSDSFEARKKKYTSMLNSVEEKLPVQKERKNEKTSLIKSVKAFTDF